MIAKQALRSQVEEVISILENHLVAWSPSRDEIRSLQMCIHRLERGLQGKSGVDPARALADYLSA